MPGVGGLSLGLVILQWNAFSIVTHGAEFKHLLENLERAPSMVRIQETFLNEDMDFIKHGCVALWRDGENDHCGVVTLILKGNFISVC